MLNRLYKWLNERFQKSNIALLNKVAKSMKRDKKIPMRYLLRKAVIYFLSMVTAPFNLLRCDRVGKRPRTRRRPYIENMGKVYIGDDVNINSRNVQTDLVSGPEGVISIGDSVSINFGVSIVANKEVRIGSRVRIGPYTMIYDSNQHVHGDRFKRAKGSSVVVEDDVWLASRVMILQGSRIGKGSLVASGSVVSGIIPPYVVAAGSPARVVKFLDPPESSGFMWERNIEKTDPPNRDVLNRVQKVASDVLPIDTEGSLNQAFHDKYHEWDSFQHIKFINALENEFNITFDIKELTRIKSISKAAGIVQRYLDNGNGFTKQVS